jgi:hypothetical protein
VGIQIVPKRVGFRCRYASPYWLIHRFPATSSQSCFFSPSPFPIISAITGNTEVSPGRTITPANALWYYVVTPPLVMCRHRGH